MIWSISEDDEMNARPDLLMSNTAEVNEASIQPFPNSQKNPALINGIVPMITAQDLIDRTLTIDLQRVVSRHKLTEIVREFNKNMAESNALPFFLFL